MKIKFIPHILMALLLTTLSGLSQTVFFSDTFGNGSTLTNLTPANPTPTSASYQLISTKAWTPAPVLATGDFRFGLPSTSGGTIEAQAIFTTNPVVLQNPGDYIQLTVVFTNTAGQMTTNGASNYTGQLDFGLYNSEQTNPIAGGLDNLASTANPNVAGGTTEWAGYIGQLSSTGSSSQILTRPQQTATTANDQDVLTTGSGSESFGNTKAATIGTAVASTLVISTNQLFTEVLTISYAGTASENITNSFYAGVGTNNANLITSFGAVATNATFMSSAFDSLAIGWLAKSTATGPTTIDITSIQVSGQGTAISGPPLIQAQPTPVTVANGGFAQFSVTAIGVSVAYQWYHNGTALSNSGDDSGVNTSTLVVDPSGPGDAGPYYCKVSGLGNYSTNSVTNSLTLSTPANLVWTGGADGTTWDVNNTANFEISGGNTPATFIGGDAVTFDDNDANGNTIVNETGNLGPSSMYVSTGTKFTFTSSGSIVGPASVILDGQGANGQVALNAANTYTGGTVLSNGVDVLLQNYGGLGNGPVTLGFPNGTMEIVNAGSATVGVNGNILVSNNFTFQMDGNGTFASVFFGNLQGPGSDTLTFNPKVTGTTNRIRLYGTNTICNANISIDPNSSPTLNQAQYYGTEIAFYNASGNQAYNGIISGSGGVIARGTGTAVLAGQNTYSGGTTPTAGNLGIGANSSGPAGSPTSGPFGTGAIYLAPEVPATTGSGTIISAGGAFTIGNPIVNPSVTNNLELIVAGTNNITFSGPFGLNGIDASSPATNRTVSVSTTNITAFFSGQIGDSGQGYGFIKTGSGILSMTNSTESYTGPTIVNGGTLLVDSGINSASAVQVQTNGVLGGVGTIPGSVTITNGGALMAGDLAIGTLNVGPLTFSSTATNIVQINKTASTHDLVNVTGLATYNGNLYVTNLSGTILLSDSFKIFNATSESGGFTNIVGTPGPNLAWVFTPSTGFLTVSQTVVIPTISPKITSFTITNANVSITATNGVNNGTYYLLGTTSVAPPVVWTPVATNVVTASGGSETFNFTGTNVFSTGTPAKFFELSSTNN